MKNSYFIIIAILMIIYIVYSIRKKSLNIKTSFLWLCSSFIMLFLAIFPYSIDWLAKVFNINYPPALFLTLCIIFLIIINFNFSKKISEMQSKIIDLAQYIALLEEKSKKHNDK